MARMSSSEIPALIRVPLVRNYFERIHPFWNGKGRVGRVLEATVLHGAGFRYAPSRWLATTRGNKIRQRDLSGRREQELLVVAEKGLIWTGVMRANGRVRWSCQVLECPLTANTIPHIG